MHLAKKNRKTKAEQGNVLRNMPKYLVEAKALILFSVWATDFMVSKQLFSYACVKMTLKQAIAFNPEAEITYHQLAN